MLVEQFGKGRAAGEAAEADAEASVDVWPLLPSPSDLASILIRPRTIGAVVLVGPSENLLN